eukprot:14088163-Ditylum_brightwellii.AAC.1
MEKSTTEMAEWSTTFDAKQKKRFKEQDKKNRLLLFPLLELSCKPSLAGVTSTDCSAYVYPRVYRLLNVHASCGSHLGVLSLRK